MMKKRKKTPKQKKEVKKRKTQSKIGQQFFGEIKRNRIGNRGHCSVCGELLESTHREIEKDSKGRIYKVIAICPVCFWSKKRFFEAKKRNPRLRGII